MQVNIPKLRGKIAEAGYKQYSFALKIGMDASTLRRKMKNGGGDLKLSEVQLIAEELQLTDEEILMIFLGRKASTAADEII